MRTYVNFARRIFNALWLWSNARETHVTCTKHSQTAEFDLFYNGLLILIKVYCPAYRWKGLEARNALVYTIMSYRCSEMSSPAQK